MGVLKKLGQFCKFNPVNNLLECPNTNFVMDGYEVVVEGDYYNVIKK